MWERAYFLAWRRDVKKSGEDQVHHYYHENRFDHGGGGRTAHLLGTKSGGKSFLATYGGNHQTEHHGFDEPGHNVAYDECIEAGRNIRTPGKTRSDDAEHAATEYAHEIGPGSKAGHHEDHGQEFRSDQEW